MNFIKTKIIENVLKFPYLLSFSRTYCNSNYSIIFLNKFLIIKAKYILEVSLKLILCSYIGSNYESNYELEKYNFLQVLKPESEI